MDHLEPIRLYYAFTYNVPIKKGANDGERRKYAKFIQTLCDQSFQFEVKQLSHEKIAERLDFHLRTFLRNGGEKADWIMHTKALIPANISPEQKDAFLNWIEQHEQALLPKQKGTPKLTINQIALFHVYESKQVTRNNGNEIAKQFNQNSGEKLFQRFTYWSSTLNRKGKPIRCTPKTLKNKIKLFEIVINLLAAKAKQRANDELNILKTIFENEYS